MKKLIGHPSISALGERLISHGGNMLVNIKKKVNRGWKDGSSGGDGL